MSAALERVSGELHALSALYPQNRLITHFTGGWVGPRAVMEGWKISSPTASDLGSAR